MPRKNSRYSFVKMVVNTTTCTRMHDRQNEWFVVTMNTKVDVAVLRLYYLCIESEFSRLTNQNRCEWGVKNCKLTWPAILTPAFPARVARKKVQNGIKRWPQQIPHRSKNAFGHAAIKKTPRKPCLVANTWTYAINKKIGGGVTLNPLWRKE